MANAMVPAAAPTRRHADKSHGAIPAPTNSPTTNTTATAASHSTTCAGAKDF
jgi:hypothetical protein